MHKPEINDLTKMQLGSLVRDIDSDQIVIIVREGPTWIDGDGSEHVWDFEVVSGEEGFYFVDTCELELVK